MEVLINTCPSFPILSQIQKSSFISLVSQLSSSAEKAKYDTALVRAHQRVAVFYDIIRGRLSETGLDIAPLLDLPDVSVTVPPPAQPLVPHDFNVKGNFTQMNPSMEVLDLITNPTLLREWFVSWRELWNASWVGPGNEAQLLALIKIKMSAGWKNSLSNVDWSTLTILYLVSVDVPQAQHHPPALKAGSGAPDHP